VKNRVAILDAEQVEDVELPAAIGTKMNSRKWVKKRESQVGKLDELKLKTVVLHGDRDGEIYMT